MFSNIILTSDEEKTLKLTAKRKRLSTSKINQDVLHSLINYGFVKYQYSGKVNSIGESIHDNVILVTDLYWRYRKYQRNAFIEKKVPIIISILALIISSVALYFSYISLFNAEI